eukprot:s5560_g2.t1
MGSLHVQMAPGSADRNRPADEDSPSGNQGSKRMRSHVVRGQIPQDLEEQLTQPFTEEERHRIFESVGLNQAERLPEGRSPIALWLFGPPAAGKTSISDDFEVEFFGRSGNAVCIDGSHVRDAHTGFQQVLQHGIENEVIHADAWTKLKATKHVERLKEEIFEIAVRNRQNVKICDACQKPDRVRKMLALLEGADFEMHALQSEFFVPRYMRVARPRHWTLQSTGTNRSGRGTRATKAWDCWTTRRDHLYVFPWRSSRLGRIGHHPKQRSTSSGSRQAPRKDEEVSDKTLSRSVSRWAWSTCSPNSPEGESLASVAMVPVSSRAGYADGSTPHRSRRVLDWTSLREVQQPSKEMRQIPNPAPVILTSSRRGDVRKPLTGTLSPHEGSPPSPSSPTSCRAKDKADALQKVLQHTVEDVARRFFSRSEKLLAPEVAEDDVPLTLPGGVPRSSRNGSETSGLGSSFGDSSCQATLPIPGRAVPDISSSINTDRLSDRPSSTESRKRSMLAARRALTSCFDGVLDIFQDVPSSLGWATSLGGALTPVRLSEGKASYCCKFMETPRYLFEKEYGKEWFTRIGEFHGFAGLIKILATVPKKTKLTNLQPNFDASTANTAIGPRS